MKNAETKKNGHFDLAQLCSQIVSFLCFFIFACFAENTIKIGVSGPPKTKENKKNNNIFYKLKTGPSIS